MRQPRIIITLCLLATIIVGCTGLAGEPEIVATLTPSVPIVPTELALGYPENTPDLTNGALIFARNCTECHGVNGDGQGALVLNGQVPEMDSFLDASALGFQSPNDYYDIITDGNIENLMPPWVDSLSEQERWDVALYTYTLGYTDEQLSLGEELYIRECAECHDADGRGEGIEVTSRGNIAFDLTNNREMIYIGDGAVRVSIVEGIGEIMPSYPELTEAEVEALVAYSRSFTFDNRQSDDTPLPNPDITTLSGTITNGTANSELPVGLDVNLRYGSVEDGISSLTTTINADGSYIFDDVPLSDNFEYVVVVFYNDIPFNTDVINGADLLSTSSLDITIYERTEDPFVISISHLDTQIDTFTVPEIGTGLVFTQNVTYTNESDRVYTTSQPIGEGRFASLLWQLPVGSVILNDPSNPRYLLAQSQYAIIDTSPVYPGENTLEAIYFQPYEMGAIIDQPLTNPLAGTHTITVIPSSVSATGDGLTIIDDTIVDGRVFEQPVELNVGESLVYELVGELTITRNTSESADIITSDVLPLILIVVVGIVLGFSGYIVYRQANASVDVQINKIVNQLAQLEIMHNNGNINHDAYRKQQADLNAKLAELRQDNISQEITDE